jgi:hypothetical protein
MSYEDYKLGVRAYQERHGRTEKRRLGGYYAGLSLAVIAPVSAVASFITAWVIAVQADGEVATALRIGFASLALIPVAAYLIGANE